MIMEMMNLYTTMMINIGLNREVRTDVLDWER